MKRLLRSLQTRLGGVISQPGEYSRPTESLHLNFPAFLERSYPDTFQLAWEVAMEVADLAQKGDFSSLEKKSPGLKGYDWGSYITLSVMRALKAHSLASGLGVKQGRVLDYGSYFLNFSRFFQRLGYQVTALDDYEGYGDGLAPFVAAATGDGCEVLDYAQTGFHLEKLSNERFDVILLMGVIEHIPHTPRLLLEGLDRHLAPGGVLVMDTPNVAYYDKRDRLARGESIYPPVEAQYLSDIHFEGHHREYTMGEIEWILQHLGHDEIIVEAENFSVYWHETISGETLKSYQSSLSDSSLRELIYSASRHRPVHVQ